jgi:hypothetical protein
MTTTTQKPSLANLIEYTNIPESLVRAVVRQMGGWESFKESAPNITRHGISGGFHGFIYYTDTLRFAHTHREAILEMASEQAKECGLGLVEMIEGFNCLKDCKPTDLELVEGLAGISNEKQVPNALAWFAGEEVARAYCNMTEGVS